MPCARSSVPLIDGRHAAAADQLRRNESPALPCLRAPACASGGSREACAPSGRWRRSTHVWRLGVATRTSRVTAPSLTRRPSRPGMARGPASAEAPGRFRIRVRMNTNPCCGLMLVRPAVLQRARVCTVQVMQPSESPLPPSLCGSEAPPNSRRIHTRARASSLVDSETVATQSVGLSCRPGLPLLGFWCSSGLLPLGPVQEPGRPAGFRRASRGRPGHRISHGCHHQVRQSRRRRSPSKRAGCCSELRVSTWPRLSRSCRGVRVGQGVRDQG